MPEPGPILAAGVVVLRKPSGGAGSSGGSGGSGEGARDVLLVHRPKYDDWSFPKGKLDPGEHVTAAAVREVAEETGVAVRLGPALSTQTYRVQSAGRLRAKEVRYWVGWATGEDDVSDYAPNDEVDEVAWVAVDKARTQLSYPHDVDTLDEAMRHRKKSYPLVVLRHGKALPRSDWERDDRKRPLADRGELQAEQLVPVLEAYDVSRLVSSSSRRCWTTLAPYAEHAGLAVEETDHLAEEEGTPKRVRRLVDDLLQEKGPAVLCTHRPVLPLVFSALGLEPAALDPGAFAVVHHRRGRVVAFELQPPTTPA